MRGNRRRPALIPLTLALSPFSPVRGEGGEGTVCRRRLSLSPLYRIAGEGGEGRGEGGEGTVAGAAQGFGMPTVSGLTFALPPS